MQKQVMADVVIADRHLSGRGRTTVMRLTWLVSDPLAVHLTLTATPDHPSLPRGTWVVLRDFLRYGLDEPTGDGAVRLRPAEGRHGSRVRLDLWRDCGDCWVTLPADVVRDFLDATEALVPTGEECSDATLDALLARLLITD